MLRYDWRDLRRQLRAVLRAEGQPVRLSRGSRWADAVFAVLVTAVVLLALRQGIVDGQYAFSDRPVPPVPPVAPGVPVPDPPVQQGLASLPFSDQLQDYAMGGLAGLALAARRRFPLATFWVVLVAIRADYFLPAVVTLLVCGVAICAATWHSRNPIPVLGSFTLASLLITSMFQNAVTAVPPTLILMLVLGLLVAATRLWRIRVAATRFRIAELQQEQAEATRRAVEEERSRIASELHDVVTHNVSVMVIQAGAARTVLDSAPELAKEAMLAVEAGGRAAMAELRHVMGLLAASGTGAGKDLRDGRPSADELVPQPGLGQLPDLVDRVRAAGIAVSVSVSLPPEPLLSGIDLTAYRVVQEALTNTIKHAVGASSSVTVGHDGGQLEIEVVDTGGTPGFQSLTGNSRGLLGLRERLAVYGGTLDAGRTISGGYRIKARIPLEHSVSSATGTTAATTTA
ncbi:sensor histidine kinase [Streptacidiphilus carbonis]|uniref:sensor histidine kinase n=1 Tax=Streptacidiphilus carbonis TaxID=105422 RepID=UPI0005A9EC97|nr:histidine kinase [Streptacidiphilus carbonis]